MKALKIICDILPPLIMFMGMIIMLKSFTSMQRLLQKQIIHLYNLVGIIANGMCSPIHRSMYMEILQRGYNKPLGKNDGYKLYQEHWDKEYQRNRKNLEKRLSETNDPVEKIRLEKILQALDDSHNMLSTLSPESSDEYAAQVLANVANVMSKLVEE